MDRFTKVAGAMGLMCAALLVAAPVSAQSQIEGRVGRLEGEMRAVQRKVFPGGAGSLQPEITGPVRTESVEGNPASSPVADLTARVGSLEQQIASLTGQVEQTGYKTRQLQDAFDAYKRQTDARLKAVEGGAGPAAATSAGGATGGGATMVDEANALNGGRTPRATSPASKPTASGTSTSNDPARPDRIAAVERPSTGDAPEDAYLYGYRLWQAKMYPEAEAQLKKVVADYPKNRRASFAQNLLGRSYLDEGKPSLASMAFYDNYKKMPDGERAPDSLQYLAKSLIKLNKPADACKVYGELADVYGAKLTAEMKADVARGRVTAKCQ